MTKEDGSERVGYEIIKKLINEFNSGKKKKLPTVELSTKKPLKKEKKQSTESSKPTEGESVSKTRRECFYNNESSGVSRSSGES